MASENKDLGDPTITFDPNAAGGRGLAVERTGKLKSLGPFRKREEFIVYDGAGPLLPTGAQVVITRGYFKNEFDAMTKVEKILSRSSSI